MKAKVLRKNNMNVIELRKTKKDHYRLFLNGVKSYQENLNKYIEIYNS